MNQYIGIIGTGTMAAGIAAGFIAHGMPVAILGRSKEKSDSCLKKAIALAINIGLHSEKTSQDLASIEAAQVSAVFTEWDKWDQCSYIIETVSENLALKQEIFSHLDEKVPEDVPIGSNSSGFPISDIAQGLSTSSRMFNTHYFMPAHIVPLVEVVLGATSDPQMAEQICSLYRAHGKKPVLVKRDIPGFLANRIQHALMREALSLVQEGIASPDDVDTAVRYSFGFRYAAVGPMTQKEISGWEGMALAAEVIYPSLSNINAPPACVMDLVSTGKTGMSKGAGFREWSPEEAREMKQVYEIRLKAAFEVLKIAPELN